MTLKSHDGYPTISFAVAARFVDPVVVEGFLLYKAHFIKRNKTVVLILLPRYHRCLAGTKVAHIQHKTPKKLRLYVHQGPCYSGLLRCWVPARGGGVVVGPVSYQPRGRSRPSD
jgi:hypothetical protein